ncbi:hypothetical protein PanWU01x14_196630 [Parasponia andersonii]|uniref:Uncharacterized protein n=1 Tax=Parasponia andersonii TaxID=3476 RepID=A0A2P5BZN0_PARAD|nr:hypothetical protein PanWU01x14_196630 [Parasponia andersonii]
MERNQWKISRGMEWWRKVVFPVRRVWTGVASRLGIRKTVSTDKTKAKFEIGRLPVADSGAGLAGILKLQHDVRACEYEDVQVMWEMLQRNETDQSPVKGKNRSLWSFFGWARSAPSLCHSF